MAFAALLRVARLVVTWRPFGLAVLALTSARPLAGVEELVDHVAADAASDTEDG